MPRPKSKLELESLSETNFQRLIEFVYALPPKEQESEFPPGTMNRNIRDVLAHLHHWHLLFLQWYELGMSGEKPEMPAPGYSWKTTSELNHWIWEHYSAYGLTEIEHLLEESHQQLTAIIKRHTNEELFEKKRYAWTGSTSLGAYLISATSSHYDWAWKLIRKAKK